MAAAGAEVVTGVGLSRRIAEEQAALRRMATLVGRATPPEEAFSAVTTEVGQLLKVDRTVLIRYEPDRAVTFVSTWTGTGDAVQTPVGSRFELGERNLPSLVLKTGRPARMDDYAGVSGAIGEIGEIGRSWGLRSAVGAPISVEGLLCAVMVAMSTSEQPLPADTEACGVPQVGLSP